MRTRFCLTLLLVGAAGCAALPQTVRIEVDGTSVTFKKKPEPVSPPAQPATDAPQP